MAKYVITRLPEVIQVKREFSAESVKEAREIAKKIIEEQKIRAEKDLEVDPTLYIIKDDEMLEPISLH